MDYFSILKLNSNATIIDIIGMYEVLLKNTMGQTIDFLKMMRIIKNHSTSIKLESSFRSS